jgi:hypothetical protein
MKRRPNADDREIAEIFRKLQVGEYVLAVEDSSKIAFMNPARLKSEGGFSILFPEGKQVHIIPRL